MGQARNWTPEEKQYVAENWGSLSVDTIAKNLNRSRNAVIVMKDRMGLGAFLDNGDYIVWNQLMQAMGITGGTGYKQKSWVKNRGFPLYKKKVCDCSFGVVYLHEFWKWAEKNMDLLDFSKFEENSLGAEPSWAKEKRRRDLEKARKYIATPWTPDEDAKLKRLVARQQYSCMELSRMLRRTEGAVQRRICDLDIKDRPVKADNHTKWTDMELRRLGEMLKAGYSYEKMSEELGKSAKGIRGRVYAMYLTENLDKARALIGTGNWGDNRPERSIKQWNAMNTQERAVVRDLLARLAAVLHHEFREQLQNTEWGEFFQKDMCQNFCAACLQTAGCDECENFVRIAPQACKMCGKTFYERKQNNYCQTCRDMRRKQFLRKQAALAR